MVVKLAGSQAEYACPFEKTAVIHKLVAKQSNIPMPNVIVADTTYQKWPWRYTIKEHVSGIEFAHARLQMDSDQLTSAYRQIGENVAQLHQIKFPAFGELNDHGQVEQELPCLQALKHHSHKIIQNERLRDYFTNMPIYSVWYTSQICAMKTYTATISFLIKEEINRTV